MFLIGPLALAAIPAGISAAGSIFGGMQANKARREEAARNRSFQERMRNTEWQAAVSDMEAAGINPAVAYSKGGASSPGGSMASQEDVISPGVSSALQTRRLTQDLKLIDQQIRKVQGEADISQAKGEIEQFRTRYLKTLLGGDDKSRMPIIRFIEAELAQAEAGARKEGSQADILGPAAGVSAEFMPILMSLSKMSAGGLQGIGDLLNKLFGRKR